MESVNTVALRNALMQVADAEGMPLSHDDIGKLVKAAAEATTWCDEVQMLHMTGRKHNRSVGDWCMSYNVPRQYMARREDVIRGLNSMPGRGRRRDLTDDSESA